LGRYEHARGCHARGCRARARRPKKSSFNIDLRQKNPPPAFTTIYFLFLFFSPEIGAIIIHSEN
jgi:hypothetical protein